MYTQLIKVASVSLGLFLSTSFAAQYPRPPAGTDVIGQVQVIKANSGDTLDSIGDRYEVGLHEMMEANPKIGQNQRLRGGSEVVVPTEYVLPPYRTGIVVNLAELRLYYFTPDSVYTYPVGLGRDGWRSPIAATTVVRKQTNPSWNVPKSIKQFVYEQTGRVLPDTMSGDDPENPLGEHALYLGGAATGILIHGTIQPYSIGKYVSSGCIRLDNHHVAELYSMAGVGTPVKIVHMPYKAGWRSGKLYVESQVPVELDAAPGPLNELNYRSVIEQAAAKKPTATVDWRQVSDVIDAHRGIPTPVGYVNYYSSAD